MSGKEAKTESIALDDLTKAQGIQTLSKEVIEYLSKEIETTTTNMMVYRSKIAFAVFLGPFLLLLAIVANTKGLSISLNLGWLATFAISIVWCFCFLTLAFMNARIEQQAWRQCNRWRQLIAQIHNDPSTKIRIDDLCDDLYKKTRKTQFVYVAAYAVLLASFIMSIIIIVKLRVPEPPTNSRGTNISTPTK
jgi:hypothetical protein